jgi:hypothetical protein
VLTGGLISSTGNIQGGNLRTVGIISATGSVTGAGITGATVSASGNVTGGNILTGGLISATGNVTTAGNVIIGSSVNSQIYNSGANLEIQNNSSGNINFRANIGGLETNVFRILGIGGVALSGNLVSMFANGAVANGVSNIGSASGTFNTIFAKATSAQYADLAEMYCADAEYTPGTVLDFGGTEEVTITTQSHSTQAAGIVSTNPSYLMNSTLTCVNAVQVALVGRVPCSVVGTIRKGDRLVSSDRPGVAQALNTNLYQPGCIVGKALEEYNSTEPGVIEVAVGNT